MQVVVADTSPLHDLILIEAIELLPCLFAQVHAPREVQAELLNNGAPQIVRRWAVAPPDWLTLHDILPDHTDISVEALDDGERAAILLAGVIQSNLLLIDERAGSAVAEAKGFAVMGTLGILRHAARLGMVDLPETLIKLRMTNFHVRQTLIDRLLAEEREYRKT